MVDDLKRRQHVQSGAPWESIHGYSRAVRSGSHIAVSGTAPVGEDGSPFGGDDMYRQTVRCLEIIEAALQEVGADVEDVVRTRIYTTDIGRWAEIARAHSEYFGNTRPASTMVEVRRLIAPEFLVEIDADAICDR